MWGRFRRKEQDVGAVQKVLGQFRTSRSARSEGGAYRKAVGLGISALVVHLIILLSVWLLRRRAREEVGPDMAQIRIDDFVGSSNESWSDAARNAVS